jgi:NAD(P)H-hydrate epimerase
VKFLSRQQVRQVDRLAVEKFHIPAIVLMENAARAVAQAALDMLAPHGARALVICGGGNNGGDGLAAARHLKIAGKDVTIALTVDPAKYQGDALTNWRIIEAMGIPVIPASPDLFSASDADLIIDAIFGTGLSASPRDPYPALFAAINSRRGSVLAVDIPSGLDCDTGQPWGSCVRATRTVTFVAQKIGFANPGAQQYLGEVVVAPIGCPVAPDTV